MLVVCNKLKVMISQIYYYLYLFIHKQNPNTTLSYVSIDY
jgi:hypothetical protein